MDDKILYAIVFGLLFVLFASKFIYEKLFNTYCEEESGGKKYKVQCGYKEAETAANLLAKLNITALDLISHMNKKYGDKDTDAGFLTNNLVKKYRGYTRLVETDPNNSQNDTAYTLDKGYLVSMCLRYSKSKEDGKFHNYNTLVFVLIHELAHISSDVTQHPDRYWDVFKFLLNEAYAAGLYNPINYHYYPESNYCTRLDINYSPLYDSGLKKIEGSTDYLPL